LKFIISISLRIVRRCKKGKWEAVTRRMIDNTMAKRILRKRKCGLSAVQWLVNCIFYLWYSAFREVVFFCGISVAHLCIFLNCVICFVGLHSVCLQCCLDYPFCYGLSVFSDIFIRQLYGSIQSYVLTEGIIESWTK
jgi:hypothetical protein